jgi:NADPH:quinone reductase-like Zn-dependent oxidoreductase
MTGIRTTALLLCCYAVSMASAAENMQAIVFSDGNFQLQTLPTPEPRAGQVRIKVRATSVNPVDWKLTERAAPGVRSIPGRDLSGVIDAVGDAAGPWKVGQAVIAIATGGSYAEYAIAAVTAVAEKPQRLSFEEAAGMPVAGETAWRALVTIADVKAGQRVLIHGGAGGVGSSAVQIAKARGAYVIATASPTHDQFLRSLGVDEPVDYHKVRFEEKLKNIDVVLNTVDADTAERSIAVLRPGGILISVAGAAPAVQCQAANIRCAVTGPATGEMLGSLSELADQGKFRIHIDRQFPLAEAAKALELSRQGHTAGKIILEVNH